MPSSQTNERACLQASGTLPQPRAQKADYLLHSLDQYSRQRVPLYTGHKAHGPADVKVTPDVPTRLTTQARRQPSCRGRVLQSCVRHPCWRQPVKGAGGRTSVKETSCHPHASCKVTYKA